MVSIRQFPPKHPWTKFIKLSSGPCLAPEMVVDDVIAAGTVVIAGERGIGKTSSLVPLLLTPTGLLNNWPMKSTIKRRVIYVSEDTAQVQRIINALYLEGFLSCDREELEQWFYLTGAERMRPQSIVHLRSELDDLYVNQPRLDGTIHCAAPVVVLDTTNATLDLEEGNSNSEVSGAIAALRQGLEDVPLILVGHVAKGSRKDIKDLTFKGAGSWEDDTQQNLYLAKDEDKRYLMLGKRRFEPPATEYLLQSHTAEMETVDVLGNPGITRCFFAVPEASSQEARDAVKEQVKVEREIARSVQMDKDIIDFVGRNPGASQSKIRKGVAGRNGDVVLALDVLIEEGQIEVKQDKNKRSHYPGKTIPERLDDVGDRWGSI